MGFAGCHKQSKLEREWDEFKREVTVTNNLSAVYMKRTSSVQFGYSPVKAGSSSVPWGAMLWCLSGSSQNSPTVHVTHVQPG